MLDLVRREGGLLLPLSLLLMMGIWGYQLTSLDPVPDFADSADIQAKKDAFFEYLKPHIESINNEIENDRERIVAYSQEGVGFFDYFHFRRMRLLYLNSDTSSEDVFKDLLLRVDQVPVSLALIQAAKESGWGSSRFARKGFNFFGHQCFQRGCGFTPRNRSAGRRHEVAKFESVEHAVRAYVHNLNTHRRYKRFRTHRAALRKSGERLRGTTLAAGLEHYSERGIEYVNEVRSMIRRNDLE